MIIEPIIDGVVARSAHPLGCEKAIEKQIEYVKSVQPINDGPKRVLIIGGSSGLGLASRIALTFGGAKADTISVSFEKPPTSDRTGSAGFYNDHYFQKFAQDEGRIAVNISGDAFSKQVKNEVVEAIETYFEGEVDLVIYSLASGVRPDPQTGELWRSSIKPIGQSVTGSTLILETDEWRETTLTPATEQEAESTIKVMGGEDWEDWVDTLTNSESIAPGCNTIAFSYMGPECTHPIYLDGTLGRAKIDLHQTSHSLNIKLANYGGNAYATVCKALVTKASVFIPALTPYIIALYKVMKEQGTHEGCIEQMQRLFSTVLYGTEKTPVDCERLIRIDDRELDKDTQSRVNEILMQLNSSNFKELGDYEGFKEDFLKINGFGFENIDYTNEIDSDAFVS